jgi:polyferredoxin
MITKFQCPHEEFMKRAAEATTLALTQPVKDAHRWALAGIMLTVIAIGWKYPALGFIVPLAMVTGIAGSFSRGRYVCGNLCPRGSFYDTVFRLMGGTRRIPELVQRPAFRWTVLAGLMGFMALQIARKPADPLHWGYVFWLACVLTTAVGVVFGTVYRARTWCAFCPVGTMAATFGGGNHQLQIAETCRSCGVCEGSCPMGFVIAEHREVGILPHRDCLKCSACVDSCSRSALNWPPNNR